MASVELKRSLGLGETTLLSIGNIIGAGVFLLLGAIVKQGKDHTVPIFLIAMILNVFCALTYAELGAMYQSNSVEYDAVKDSFGVTVDNVSTATLLIRSHD